jgi:hypothetical protein
MFAATSVVHCLLLWPVQGYEGKDVSIVAALLDDVHRHVVQQFSDRETFLFWYPDGNPVKFKAERRSLNLDDNVRYCAERGGCVVWVSSEKSPNSIPTKWLPVTFFTGDCPVFFEDVAMKSLQARIVGVAQGTTEDKEHVLIFAVPGCAPGSASCAGRALALQAGCE